MDPELFTSIAGFVLAIVFFYVPAVANRFNALPSADKARVMGGMIALVAVAVAVLSCTNVVIIVPCTAEGLRALAQNFLIAFVRVGVANVASYMLFVRPFKSKTGQDDAVRTQVITALSEVLQFAVAEDGKVTPMLAPGAAVAPADKAQG